MILNHHGLLGTTKDNFIYHFDPETFNLQTLRDKNAQWSYSNSRPVELTKKDGYLQIYFTYGTKQYFDLNMSSLGIENFDNYIIDTTYSGTLPYYSFFGYVTCSFRGDNNAINGFWHIRNRIASAYGYRAEVPANFKFHIITEEQYKRVKVYQDNTYITDFIVDPATYITHNVDYNGSSVPGSINLHKLDIYLP